MQKISQLKAAVWDTHAWVWAAAGDTKAGALKDFQGIAYLSAISVWEVSMLVAKGRLELRPDVRGWIKKNLHPPIHLEAIDPETAILSTELSDLHGDPADRLIVATAIVSGLPLISADDPIVQWAKKTRRLDIFCPATGNSLIH
jgi:PIN domain nuclease of toxin-antitoxin system